MKTDDALRTSLIKLAHENPTLRPHLLPLITAATKDERYHLAIIEAVEKADQLRRPVEVRKNALGGYSVNLFMMDRKTGLPTEAVRGEIIKPGHPLSAEQKRLKDMKTA